jgi:hypothetical protein
LQQKPEPREECALDGKGEQRTVTQAQWFPPTQAQTTLEDQPETKPPNQEVTLVPRESRRTRVRKPTGPQGQATTEIFAGWMTLGSNSVYTDSWVRITIDIDDLGFSVFYS